MSKRTGKAARTEAQVRTAVARLVRKRVPTYELRERVCRELGISVQTWYRYAPKGAVNRRT